MGWRAYMLIVIGAALGALIAAGLTLWIVYGAWVMGLFCMISAGLGIVAARALAADLTPEWRN